MLLRRITEHVKAQNWFAVGIDFVIVVVGVFMGLQVQVWSNGRADRQQEKQIVADLLADLEIDRSHYATSMSNAARRIGAANDSLESAGLPSIEFDWEGSSAAIHQYSLDVSSTADLRPAEQDRLWTYVVIAYFPTPSTSTYDSIIGAGDIKIIRNRNIVRQLQMYRNLLGTVDSQNEKLREIRSDVLGVGVTHGLAPYARMSADDFFNMVESEADLAAAIRLMATFSIFHLIDIERADARAAELQSLLKDYQEETN